MLSIKYSVNITLSRKIENINLLIVETFWTSIQKRDYNFKAIFNVH